MGTKTICSTAAALMLATLPTPYEAAAADAEKLNVVLVISDQHRWDMMGAAGDPVIKTPYMDRLAAEGVRLNHHFTPYPLCGPSRACLLTGQYPQTNQVHFNGEVVPMDRPRMSRAFNEAGYFTSTTGIIDLEPRRGDLQGWDDYESSFYYQEFIKSKGVEEPNYWREVDFSDPFKGHCFGALEEPAEWHHDHWVASRAAEKMEEYAKRDQPFFVRVGLRLPHPPYLAPAPYDTMYDAEDIPMPASIPREGITYGGKQLSFEELREAMAWFYAVTSFTDSNLGIVMDKMDELDLWDNTIFIYTTDHGNMIGHHGWMGKRSLYDDDARIPFLIRYPGQGEAGRVVEGFTSIVDIMPTLLDMVGGEIPRGVQGRSFYPMLKGQDDGPAYVYGYQRGERQMIRSKDWKLIHVVDGGESLLFDLRNDPQEINNLYGNPQYAGIQMELKSKLLEWHLTLEDETIPNSFTEREEFAEYEERYMESAL